MVRIYYHYYYYHLFVEIFFNNVIIPGPKGDSVTVETMVMQVMKQEYEDGVLFEYSSNNDLNAKEIVSTSKYQHLCGDWIGWHTEGSILRSIYSLLMWDELFETCVNDVFQTKYQEAPLDLYADNGLFYFNRSSKIEEKLTYLESISSKELIGKKTQ